MKGMIIMNKYKKYTKNEIDMLKKHIKLKKSQKNMTLVIELIKHKVQRLSHKGVHRKLTTMEVQCPYIKIG